MAHSACVRCGTCDGFPCLVHAKSDAEVIAVRPALEHPNVTLLTNARALALRTNQAGTAVTEMEVNGGESERFYRRHRRRLLRRRQLRRAAAGIGQRQAPAGLANGSDQVGRNYTFHNSQAVLALSKEENPTIFQKTLGVNDFYFGADFEYPMGNIQMVGKSQRRMYRGEKPVETKLAPNGRWRAWPGTRSTSGSRPRTCRGRTTGSRSTGTGRPAELHGDQPGADEAPLRRAQGPPEADRDGTDHLIPRHAYLKNEIPVAGCAHQAGTCRFGDDPATSVLNTDCRAHEVDNLYVVDTSFFPSIGAVNPALTAMANALRVGDHLLERMGAPGGKRAWREPGAHVIVVGGGFAGLRLRARLARHSDVRVTLLDRNNYHQFQPLLYQVATSQLGSSSVAMSLRKIFRKHPNVHVKMAEVASIDPGRYGHRHGWRDVGR